jgi:serine/threonine-protein kinase
MTPTRWAQIKEIFEAALEVPASGWVAFLDSVCGSDIELRAEVERLLAQDTASLQSPIAEVPAALPELAAGEMLSHYRVEFKLGEGGMGSVYRAYDTQLRRSVALKVLAPERSDDTGSKQRLLREARAASALNHANIVGIYEVGSHNGTDFIAMEYVDGKTLREAIPAKGLPLAKALDYAVQIAGGLTKAHAAGVVHGDLKPGNIMLAPDNVIKLLDFGLARRLRPAVPGVSTETLEQGLAGTPGYMAPEQIEGKTVDARTDIFAFGCVLYEMLTGEQPFAGDSVAKTMAAVLAAEPAPLSKLRPGIPLELERIVTACLAKDPQERFQSVRDVKQALEWAADVKPPHGTSRRWVTAGALILLAAIVAVGAGWRITRTPKDTGGHAARPLVRLDVDLGPDAVQGIHNTVAISPDGQRMVYQARGPDGKPRLATRLLDQAHGALLPSTENGSDPFFSPDGQWVGFWAEGKLKKIPVNGGEAITLLNQDIWGVDGDTFRGGSWGEDGNIITGGGPLSRVPASGGPLRNLTKLTGGEATQMWPQTLPGGQAILFTGASTLVGMENANIGVLVLKSGATKILWRRGYYGRYLPTGHLVFVRQGVLFGVGFDAERLEIRGIPTPLLEDVAGDSGGGGGQFDFSRTGTFVYVGGKGKAPPVSPIVWIDRFGKTQPLLRTAGVYNDLRLSPDGSRLALTATSMGTDIFVYDWRRDVMTRLTFDGHSAVPVWSPDGKHIAFQSTSGGYSLSWVRSDGSGQPQRLLESQNILYPSSFSADGRWLAYHDVNYTFPHDGLWTLPLNASDPDHPKPGKPELLLSTGLDNQFPKFSPDGRWIVYRSIESGAWQVWVRPFPGPGGKWQVSEGGGTDFFWAKDGRELFYVTPDKRIMVVGYTTNGDSFVAGKPRAWSEWRVNSPGRSRGLLDLAPDGTRFAGLPLPEAAAPEKGSLHVIFLLNFFDELRRRVPASGK